MKHLFIAVLSLMPLLASAQSTWERPQTQTQQEEQPKRKALIEKKNKQVDSRYLEGAVPLEDGKVVFTLERDLSGMSDDEIYDRLYTLLDEVSRDEHQHDSKQSQIAVVNKKEHTIAARYKEWLVFQNSFLSLDRTVFCYTVIARVNNGHLKVTMERISYQYEKDRTDNSSGGLDAKAEEWISDKVAINKKKTGFTKFSGKFRIKTIDRKDELFAQICDKLGIN